MLQGNLTLFKVLTACPSLTLEYVPGSCANATFDIEPYSMRVNNLIPNTTYYLRISTVNATDTVGRFVICASVPTPPPACPTYIRPSSNQMNVPVNSNVVFEWTAETGSMQYRHYMGTTNPPTTLVKTTMRTLDTKDTLKLNLYNTKYYWSIVPVDYVGAAAVCSVDSFTTQPALPNCIPQTTFGCTMGDALKLFSLLGVDSTSIYNASSCGASGYTDYTASSSVKLATGRSFAGSFVIGKTGGYASVWIDFNNDGQLTPGERVLNNLRGAGKDSVTPFSIHIPTDAPLGIHKLRVRIIDSADVNSGPADPCNIYAYSETEDYTVIIDTPKTGSRLFVSNSNFNNCNIANALTLDNNTNNNNKYIDIIDERNNIIAAIKANGNNLGTVTARLYINNGAVRSTSNGTKILDRNITITPQFQPLTPVDVRLYLLNTEFLTFQNADPTVADITNLNVIKTETDCGVNSPIPVNGISLPQLNNGFVGPDRYIDVSVTGFSTFYIGNSSHNLPVTLTSFSGEKAGNTNKLDWQTLSEINNKGFEIQRSVDGINFSSIGYVSSKINNGNSNNPTTYQYIDNKPFPGNNYYQLKQFDNDGKTVNSKVVLIRGNKIDAVYIRRIYPTPTKNKINISISSPITNNIRLIITDVTGRSLMQKVVQVNTGDNIVVINVADLSAGIYFVKAFCEKGCDSAVNKFVKE
jgi:hypothetical protein